MGVVGSRPDSGYWMRQYADADGNPPWAPDVLSTWGIQHVQMVWDRMVQELGFGFSLDRDSFRYILTTAGISKMEMSVINRGVDQLDRDLWDLLTEPRLKQGARRRR